MIKKILLTALAMVCLAFAWLWYETHKAYDVQGVNGQGFDVQIAKGDPTLRIAENLWYVGVIDSPLLFRFVARVTGSGPKMRAGWYHFEGKMSLWQVMDKVRRGDVKQFYLTVPEGLKTFDVLSLLAQETKTNINDWQAALKRFLPDQETEGRLLPETYQYIHPIDPRRILRTMINTQDKLLFQLAETPEERARLRIIASVIEKETSQDDERPLVSAAIYNRLRLKMPLQMDPTVIYGIWKRDGVFSGNIHRKDLKTDTPWNTYTRRGLPPTPICNPGAASLRAAAKPADVSYVYFVADGTGGHAFASTLAEHQANVRKWVRLERKSNIKKHVEKNFK